MTNHPKRPRDLNQWAKRMVDIATGETIDREPQVTTDGHKAYLYAMDAAFGGEVDYGADMRHVRFS